MYTLYVWQLNTCTYIIRTFLTRKTKKRTKRREKKAVNRRSKDKMQEHQHLGVSSNVSRCNFSFLCGTAGGAVLPAFFPRSLA